MNPQTTHTNPGRASIVNATIGGQLSFRGATIDNDGKECLVLDGTTIGGDLLFDEANDRRFESNGALCLRGISVNKSANFTGARLKGTPDALLMTGSKIGANLSLKRSVHNRFEAEGGVGLTRVSVGAQVRMQGASLSGGQDLFALDMNQADVRGSALLCSDGEMRFEANGLVYLYAANIGRNLVLTGARVGIHVAFDEEGEVTRESREDRRPHNDAEHILKGMALDLRQIRVNGKALLGVGKNRHRFEARGLVCFNGAKIGSEIFLRGANLYNPKGYTLSFDSAQVARDVYFESSPRDRFESRGTISGWGCTIGGGLYCRGAFLRRHGGNTLTFDQATISGEVFLEQSSNADFQFVSKGTMLFERANIQGDFRCDGARFFGRTGVALSLNDATVTGGIRLVSSTAYRFESSGEICLDRAQIGGSLDLSGARLRNPNRTALRAADASIGGDVRLCSMPDRRCKTRGEVLLSRITIKGRLICRGTFLHDEQYVQPYRREERRRALSLYGGVVNDKVVMELGLRAPNEPLRFHAIGFVDLSYARIGAGVICTATRFENPEGTALSLEGAKVTGDVYLTNIEAGPGEGELPDHKKFEAVGDVDLQAVEIAGDLSCDGTFCSNRYGQDDKNRGKALVFDNGQVRHRWYVRLSSASVGEAALRGGRVGTLDDDGGRNWGPEPKVVIDESGQQKLEGIQLKLDGFLYDRFGPWGAPPKPTNWRVNSKDLIKWHFRSLLALGVDQNVWKTRSQWLKRQYPGDSPKAEDFYPQPHEQAAKALLAMGHNYDARCLLNDRAVHQVDCRADEWFSRFFTHVYSLGFGSGYLPIRALVIVAMWWALGWVAVSYALDFNGPSEAVFVRTTAGVDIVRILSRPDDAPAMPSNKAPYPQFETRDIACSHEAISPALYALDTMLPVFQLHMEEKCEFSGKSWLARLGRNLKAAYAFFGWIIVTLAALTWTGALRRGAS